jgi:hypothetical protein
MHLSTSCELGFCVFFFTYAFEIPRRLVYGHGSRFHFWAIIAAGGLVGLALARGGKRPCLDDEYCAFRLAVSVCELKSGRGYQSCIRFRVMERVENRQGYHVMGCIISRVSTIPSIITGSSDEPRRIKSTTIQQHKFVYTKRFAETVER